MDAALADLPHGAFAKADPSDDADFYASPRFVTHIDDEALAALSDYYAEVLPRDGVLLDLMSSWVSHLPSGVGRSVVGHGLNGEELDANPRLSRWFVQNLNTDPVLPLEAATFDGAMCCASVQYLERPVAVFAGVRAALRPGAPFVVSFANRCFPTKAVAIWRALDMRDQAALVALYLARAGFVDVDTRVLADGRAGDPLIAVTGRAPRRGL